MTRLQIHPARKLPGYASLSIFSGEYVEASQALVSINGELFLPLTITIIIIINSKVRCKTNVNC